jgi:hypothetical protein
MGTGLGKWSKFNSQFSSERNEIDEPSDENWELNIDHFPVPWLWDSGRDNVQLDVLLFTVGDFEACSFFFIAADEIQIHDGVLIRIFPGEDLVVAGRYQSNGEVSELTPGSNRPAAAFETQTLRLEKKSDSHSGWGSSEPTDPVSFPREVLQGRDRSLTGSPGRFFPKSENPVWW